MTSFDISHRYPPEYRGGILSLRHGNSRARAFNEYEVRVRRNIKFPFSGTMARAARLRNRSGWLSATMASPGKASQAEAFAAFRGQSRAISREGKPRATFRHRRAHARARPRAICVQPMDGRVSDVHREEVEVLSGRRCFVRVDEKRVRLCAAHFPRLSPRGFCLAEDSVAEKRPVFPKSFASIVFSSSNPRSPLVTASIDLHLTCDSSSVTNVTNVGTRHRFFTIFSKGTIVTIR